MVVEADGTRAGLLVDDLLAQQQIVIKSLKTNFRPVPGLSGATILGDGTVAMILDVNSVLGLYRQRLRWPSRQSDQAAEARDRTQVSTITTEFTGTADTSQTTDQYLTFLLGQEEYGVDILRVQEIKGWERATEIPNTPEYIRGVLNLRGTVIPIVDLRRRFELESADYTNTTVVIVLRIESDTGTRTMGFVVDAVSDVYNVAPDHVQPAPDFGARVNTQFIRGLAAVDEKMVILLDIDRLIGLDTVFTTFDGVDDPQSKPATNSPEETE